MRNEFLTQAISTIPFINEHVPDIRCVWNVGNAVFFGNGTVASNNGVSSSGIYVVKERKICEKLSWNNWHQIQCHI